MHTTANPALLRAQSLLARNFAIIPLHPQQKDPDFALVPRVDGVPGTGGAARRTRDINIVHGWCEASPDANIGVCSDDQITILESDSEQEFRQKVREVSLAKFGEARELPSTLTSQARPNRPHFFFSATPKTQSVEGAPGIQGLFEWRRENQYVVGAGSIHPEGAVYQIVNDVPIVPMPDWLVDVLLEMKEVYRGTKSSASPFIKVGPAAVARDALINKYELDPIAMLNDESFQLFVGAGERHYFLQSMAGLLHDGERTEEELEDILKQMRDKYCESGKGDYEIENLASWTVAKEPCAVEPNYPPMNVGCVVYRDAADYEAAKKASEVKKVEREERRASCSPLAKVDYEEMLAPDGLNMTQAGNAERVLVRHGQDISAVKDGRRTTFYIWDGTRWRPDTGEVETWAADEARRIGDLIADAKGRGKDYIEKLVRFWKVSESAQQIKGVVSLVGTLVKGQQFDSDAMLWNTMNGTVDLRTGNVYEPRREDYITMRCDANYNPEAKCPQWDRFLLESCAGDAELVRYLRQCAGLALTGLVEEHVFFILSGPGGTGKSTFQETLKAVWGGYCVGIDPNSLAAIKAQAGRARPDLAKLQGTRLVFANESRSGLRLDEGLVKALTGRDTVTTRHLYSAEFDFIPQFKLWLRTNHVPSFDGADTGMQRRVKLIPFNTVVTKRDASLPTKLRGESDGILQWSLRGLKDYQQNGLIEPKVVKDASKEYVESLDTLAQFLDSSCLREPRLEAPSDDLFKAYRDWASGMGLHGVGRARFAADMAARGFQKRVRDGRKYWCGLAFKEVDAGHLVVYRSGVPLAQ